ncbi:anticodon nuclease [Fusobacterium sp. FSA-380-WT-2B]|nr:anticodon nuclease [Fusobacterium sp. FSA-380-WT-2B]
MIYAFNGVGKTRLSKEFKSLISPKINEEESQELAEKKILYYNAFTEDLFYWDNDLENDRNIKFCIHPNSFTKWIFEDQGQDRNIVENFQKYVGRNLTPKFNSNFSEITFSFERGNDEISENIKISKGEESCFIWSIFYSLLKQAIDILNVADPIERETNIFDKLEYVFIDDPVTSLDENHLIELAVDLAETIRNSESHLKFIITTHNIVFYNVLCNELKAAIYLLSKNEDGTYDLEEKKGDSNKSFAYHHHLIYTLEQAIVGNKIEKYHFNLLRNLYEKAASFLGYRNWKELLPDEKETYASRIMNFYSHRSLLNDEIKEPTNQEKEMVKLLFNHLLENYKFWRNK